MSEEHIVLGGNFSPPVVCMETTKEIYECVRSEEFDVAKFNALLMAVTTYIDTHSGDYEYGDKALPWAELIKST